MTAGQIVSLARREGKPFQKCGDFVLCNELITSMKKTRKSGGDFWNSFRPPLPEVAIGSISVFCCLMKYVFDLCVYEILLLFLLCVWMHWEAQDELYLFLLRPKVL